MFTRFAAMAKTVTGQVEILQRIIADHLLGVSPSRREQIRNVRVISLARVLGLADCGELLIEDELMVEDIVDYVRRFHDNFSFLQKRVNLQVDRVCAMPAMSWAEAELAACCTYLIRYVISPAIAGLVSRVEVPEHGHGAPQGSREN